MLKTDKKKKKVLGSILGKKKKKKKTRWRKSSLPAIWKQFISNGGENLFTQKLFKSCTIKGTAVQDKVQLAANFKQDKLFIHLGHIDRNYTSTFCTKFSFKLIMYNTCFEFLIII